MLIAALIIVKLILATGGSSNDQLFKDQGNPDFTMREWATNELIKTDPDSLPLTLKTALHCLDYFPERSVRSSEVFDQRMQHHVDKLLADQRLHQMKVWIDIQIELDREGRDMRMMPGM